MKNLLPEIKMIQPRVATGRDDSGTTVMAIVDGHNGITAIPLDRAGRAGYNIHGQVVVRHPAILAGTWEEWVGEMAHVITHKLIDQGLAEQNKWGVIYLTTPLPLPHKEGDPLR